MTLLRELWKQYPSIVHRFHSMDVFELHVAYPFSKRFLTAAWTSFQDKKDQLSRDEFQHYIQRLGLHVLQQQSLSSTYHPSPGTSHPDQALAYFNTLLNGLLRFNERDDAISLFNEIPSMNCFPNYETYRHMLMCYQGLKNTSQVVKVLQELACQTKEEDHHSSHFSSAQILKLMNIGINICAENKAAGLALDVFHLIQAHPRIVQPDEFSYNSLFTAQSTESGQSTRAMSCLDEMIDVHHMNPTPVAFFSIVRVFQQDRDRTLLPRLLERMEKCQVQPDVACSNAIIDLYRLTRSTLLCELWKQYPSIVHRFHSMDVFELHVAYPFSKRFLTAAWTSFQDKKDQLSRDEFQHYIQRLGLHVLQQQSLSSTYHPSPGTSHPDQALAYFNTLLNGLLRFNERDDAISLFNEIPSMNCFPNYETYRHMLMCYQGLKNTSQVVKVLQELACQTKEEDHHSSHFSSAQILKLMNIGINICAENKAAGLALDVFHLIQAHPRIVQPDEFSYNSLFTAQSTESGQSTRAMSCLDEMIDVHHMNPTPVAFFSIVRVFQQDRDRTLLPRLLERMEKCQVQPDVACCNAIIDLYRLTGQSAAALEMVTDEMKSKYGLRPNCTSFAFAILAQNQNQEYEAALSIMDHMDSQKVVPNREVFSALIPAYGHLGKEYILSIVQKVTAVWPSKPEMYGAALDALKEHSYDDSAQSLRDWLYAELQRTCGKRKIPLEVYHRAMSSASKYGDVNRVYEMYQDMVRGNQQPNVVTHNILLHAMLKNSPWNTIPLLQIYDTMLEKDITPSIETYTMLMRSLGQSSIDHVELHVEQVLKIFQETVVNKDIVLDRAYFSQAIQALAKHELVEIVPLFLRMMKYHHIDMTKAILDKVVFMYDQHQEPQLAVDFLLDLIDQDCPHLSVHIYNDVLHICHKGMDLELAKKVFALLESPASIDGPNSDSFITMVGIYESFRQWEKAEKISCEIKKRNIQLPRNSYNPQ